VKVLPFDGLPPIGPAVVTLGVFDGVHLGHRHLVDATRRAAVAAGSASVAIVFTPHPDEILRPGTTVARLLPPEVTLQRLSEAGVDHALPVRFDDGVRGLSPEAFLDGLASGLDLRAVVMTPDSAFGRARSGTLARVTEIGVDRGFDAIAVSPAVVDGAVVSSSRIREALAAGEAEAAARLLGAAALLRGMVIHGDARGRELGFPTANLAFDYHPALPALGIYLGRVTVPTRGVGPGHPALVSIGVRPTFHDRGHVLVEVYLLDWEGDLYDATLDVEVIARLRDERRFDSTDALIEQMQHDEADARRRIGLRGG
jgi:riboflavin kinase/FMN adenylyltransferase